MATRAWVTLYEETLQSEPEDLLERIRTATELIIERFREIGLADPRIYSTEHRALCLALSDLRALRIAFSHSKANGLLCRSLGAPRLVADGFPGCTQRNSPPVAFLEILPRAEAAYAPGEKARRNGEHVVGRLHNPLERDI